MSEDYEEWVDVDKIIKEVGAVDPDDWSLPKSGSGLKAFVFGITGLYMLIAGPLMLIAILGLLGFLLVV